VGCRKVVKKWSPWLLDKEVCRGSSKEHARNCSLNNTGYRERPWAIWENILAPREIEGKMWGVESTVKGLLPEEEVRRVGEREVTPWQKPEGNAPDVRVTNRGEWGGGGEGGARGSH